MVTWRERMPVVVRNLRSAGGWRMQDMVNWHRMVRPLRQDLSAETDMDLYRLIGDLCTRFHFQYRPVDTRGVARPMPLAPSSAGGNEPRVALFVDAPGHLSGVSTTLGGWLRGARAAGLDFRVHTTGLTAPPGLDATVFPAVGRLHVPLYDGLELYVPHVHEVLQYMRRSRFDVVHLSTPGPMGLVGLMAARALGLPVCGTYHTDFPAYALTLSGDARLARSTWLLMRWFYGQLDRVASPSQSTRDQLVARGLDPRRQVVVGRGVDTGLFSPAHRSESQRAATGGGRHKLLYVGRVSAEKNLYALARAFRLLCAQRDDTDLVIVGDGPYREAMGCEVTGLPVHFAGTQRGEALARHYASADLFVFPSRTDTYGVVLIEAQASGLPVLVAPEGGPKDCMLPGVTGRVVDPMEPETLAAAIAALLDAPAERAAMGHAAVLHARTCSLAASFERFWNLHHDVERAAAPARPVASPRPARAAAEPHRQPVGAAT